MELKAVIKSLEYVSGIENPGPIEIYSDSQYVVNLLSRKQKLMAKNFLTKKGTPVQNEDLVKMLLSLIEIHSPKFLKVKAHEKNGNIYNREVDLIVRQLVRKKALENGKTLTWSLTWQDPGDGSNQIGRILRVGAPGN